MHKNSIGSFLWSESTDGILSCADKRFLFGMLLKARVVESLDRLRSAVGLFNQRRQRLDLEKISIPDSAIATEAEQIACRLYSPVMLNHCYRTYYFAVLFSQWHAKDVDLEALYVGCLLHDAGLCASHSHQAENTGFQIIGARQAFDLADKHDWGKARAINLYESISYHLNPYIPVGENAPEAAFLQRGAMMDVIGANRHLLKVEQVREVIKKYSRVLFKEEILSSMTDIRHATDSHADYLGSCGFAKLTKNNPLCELVTT